MSEETNFPQTTLADERGRVSESSALARNERVVLTRFGGAENLSLVRDEALAQPSAGQVRVRVLAAGVQFTDIIIRKGQYPDLKEKPPFTPGYDVIGEVDAIGEGVRGLSIGDRVADMTMIGSYAKYRLLEAQKVTPVPLEVDPAQASALVLGGMTAYQLLHRHAQVQPGQTVLIHGAAGAVGQLLLELGRHAGLRMFATARAPHAELIRSFGATAIDYEREDFAQVHPEGFDVIFDGIGERGFARSWAALKKGGFLSAYGFQQGVKSNAPFLKVGFWLGRVYLWNALPNGKRAGFYSISAMRKTHPDWFREDLSALFSLLQEGKIHPQIQERISLADVAEAHRRLEKGGLNGKLVIVP